MQPPPQNIPPQNPPQFAPPPAQKPKQKPTIPILAAIAIAGIGGAIVSGGVGKLFNRVAPSGMTSNGKALSRAEAQEGFKELVAMSRGAKAGDPSSLNMGVEPKTELGRNFKRLAIKSQTVEKTYADVLGGETVDALLTPKNLTSQAGRDASRTKLATIKTASATYFADTRKVSDELFRLIAGANGERAPQAPTLEAEIDGNAKGMMKLIGIAEKMLAFADKAKPKLEGSNAAFQTDAQVAEYGKIADEYNTAAEEFQAAAAKALRDRQQSLNNAISKVDSGAL